MGYDAAGRWRRDLCSRARRLLGEAGDPVDEPFVAWLAGQRSDRGAHPPAQVVARIALGGQHGRPGGVTGTSQLCVRQRGRGRGGLRCRRVARSGRILVRFPGNRGRLLAGSRPQPGRLVLGVAPQAPPDRLQCLLPGVP